jgi:hypothetical protein
LILNNYAKQDKLATFARIALGTGIICGYPLTFSALRENVFDFLKPSPEKREKIFFPLTLVFLSIITSFALVFKKVGTIVSFSGALIGSLVIFVIPAIMNIGNIFKEKNTLIL